jgi:hypothetical protein
MTTQSFDVRIGTCTYRVLATSKSGAHERAAHTHRQAHGMRSSDTVLADSITIARPVVTW